MPFLANYLFLAEQSRDELGAIEICDPEDLQDAGVRQEGAGAALVERAELVNVLQDRPELDAVARHQAHRPLDGFETAQRGKFIEIGRATCRERVCQYVEIQVVAGSLKTQRHAEYCVATTHHTSRVPKPA